MTTEHLVSGVSNRSFLAWETAVGFERAREALGGDFFTPGVMSQLLGLSYSDDQMVKLQSTLPDQAILQWLGENGMTLVPLPPVPVGFYQLCACDKGSDKALSPELHLLFEDGDTSGADMMLNSGGWLALRLRPSQSMELSKSPTQMPLERMANVCEVIYGVLAHALVRLEAILGPEFILTQTKAVGEGQITVTYDYHQNGGVKLKVAWDIDRHDYIGVMSF